MRKREFAPDLKRLKLPCGLILGERIGGREKAVYALRGGWCDLAAVVALRAHESVRRDIDERLSELPHAIRPLMTVTQGNYVVRIVPMGIPSTLKVTCADDPGWAALNMLSDLSETLIQMEKRGLLHNDIKPANIIYTDADGYCLNDFDAALPVGYTGPVRHGTEYYASPEHAKGEHTDARSDQYSLALSAYRLLSPVRCAPLNWLSERCRLNGRSVLPEVRRFGGLHETLRRALRHNPGERYPTAEDFRAALLKVRNEGLREEMLNG